MSGSVSAFLLVAGRRQLRRKGKPRCLRPLARAWSWTVGVGVGKPFGRLFRFRIGTRHRQSRGSTVRLRDPTIRWPRGSADSGSRQRPHPPSCVAARPTSLTWHTSHVVAFWLSAAALVRWASRKPLGRFSDT
jgi:hypothetical protein